MMEMNKLNSFDGSDDDLYEYLKCRVDDIDTDPEYFLDWIESKIKLESERKRLRISKNRDKKIDNIIY